jgi:2-oxoisovalerate dehydrogenase E1 component alpha subunit
MPLTFNSFRQVEKLKNKSNAKLSKRSSTKSTPKKVMAKKLPLSKELLLQIHSLMLKARVLEERLIKIYKVGESYFWIGAPGEEAFGVPLGMLINKGQGPAHDYLHLHYRGTPTLIAMGMEMIDSIRLMMNRATDPSTGGRNFSNHYCFPKWNVTPVSSPIEVQYLTAIGTAHVQRREKTDSLTVVTGGDAGTAEGDFASCLVWSSRPRAELPILITVQNNTWGISTSYSEQHGEENIADRGKAFGMRTRVINGNDPIESYIALKEEMNYIRKSRKPVLLEAKVSRLYGHSSATGASMIKGEVCCLTEFESLLFKHDILKEQEATSMRAQFEEEARLAQEQARAEAAPASESVWDHVFANNENGDWRKF